MQESWLTGWQVMVREVSKDNLSCKDLKFSS